MVPWPMSLSGDHQVYMPFDAYSMHSGWNFNTYVSIKSPVIVLIAKVYLILHKLIKHDHGTY